MTIGTVALLLPCVGGVFAVGAALSDPQGKPDRYISIVGSGSDAPTAVPGGTVPTPSAGTGMGLGLGGQVQTGNTDPLTGLVLDPNTGQVVDPYTGVVVVPAATTQIGAPGTVPPGAGDPGTPAPGTGTDPGTGADPGETPGGTTDPEMPIGGTPVDPTEPYTPVEEPTTPPAPEPPVVQTSTATEDEPVPFETEFVRDRSMPRRTYETRVQGQTGVKTRTYEVTITDGQQTGRRLISEAITQAPVTRVIAVGTGRRPGADCDNDGGDNGGGGNNGGSGGGAGPRRCNGGS
jgi:hypothetical protein